jgi:peroxiredoxin
MTSDDRGGRGVRRSSGPRRGYEVGSESIVDRLLNRRIPALILESTDGDVDLAVLASSLLVLFIYPHATGLSDEPVPGWARIPGAVGCTAEACGFRDLSNEFDTMRASVAGMSVQTTAEQMSFSSRVGIPLRLISDTKMQLWESLALPAFEAAGKTFYKRLTFVARSGYITKVFYPIDDPQNHARDVLRWLQTHGS